MRLKLAFALVMFGGLAYFAILIAVGVANVYTVNWCNAHGGTARTPFLTTECTDHR